MLKYIKVWNEPIERMKSLPAQKSEMSFTEHGFLCGLLREKRPKKILEVGVAAGGTSCVIMEALEHLCLEDGTEAVLHSVDLNERYYRDKSKLTGYMAKNMIERCPHVYHETYYGAMLPAYIDNIGGDIDFLVLDTAHTLPGEILDFLLVLPFLKKKATVVLHDIMMPLLGDNPMACATNTLIGAVGADKYLYFMDNCAGVENIGAFTLSQETVSNVENVFWMLLMRWSYGLTKAQEEEYHRYFSRYYNADCLRLFESALNLNRRADLKDRFKECYFDKREMDRVLSHWRVPQGKVVIYGIGYYGQAFVRYAQSASLEVDAFVVSDGEPIHEIHGCELPIYELSSLPYKPDECTIIIAVQAPASRVLIEKELRYRGYFRIL